MAENVKVWVKTDVLDEIVHGGKKTYAKRAIPDASNPSSGEANRNWGWARGTVINDGPSQKSSDSIGAETSIKVEIKDEDSDHNRSTVEIPPKYISEGGVVTANIYGNGADSDDEDGYDGGYDDEEDGPKYPDDLITLTHLHEPAVVYALRKRYALDSIYTSTGPILLALNPFRRIGNLYSDQMMLKYRARGEANTGNFGEEKKDSEDDEVLTPHVFGTADNCYRAMMNQLKESMGGGGGRRRKPAATEKPIDQSILVSGESGAGKTVTTKFIMKYLAQLCSTPGKDGDDSEGGIEKQVLQSNPILESFGNARTIRNDNSSRFGKYIELQFTDRGSITGASIQTYLLEKVRLVHQMPGERNYHIFYEMLQGFTDDEFDKYHIGDRIAEDFKMISMSGTYDRRDGVEDHETFSDLLDAMKIMKFSEKEQEDIMTVTCTCLHALNCEFIALDADKSEINKDCDHLEAVLALMGVEYEDLNSATCSFSIKAGRETHIRSLSKEKAEKSMQGLVKAFYGALFTYLVHRVNSSITVDSGGSDGGRGRRGGRPKAACSIGLLDIFGFESFKNNSFEQLCINFCNEALQQQFNLFVLKNEQEEYEREGIQWAFISFPENQDVLDLIGKKGSGIIPVLDDQCRAPGTTDKTFANALYQKCTKHDRFQADFRQVGALKFGVVHYAGAVEYDTAGFVEKNQDTIPREATELLSKSSNDLVKIIGKILEDPTAPIGGGAAAAPAADAKPARRAPSRGGGAAGGKKKQLTVGGQFSQQLTELRSKIDTTSPHYVRCLKPNDLLVPDNYDPVIMADQLRCAGVVEAVRVSRLGYPQRYSHNMFVNRYRILALKELKLAAKKSKKTRPVDILVNSIAKNLVKLNEKEGDTEDGDGTINLAEVGVQVGKTKVFLRRKAFDSLEMLRSQRMRESAIQIQATARKYILYRDYKQTKKAALKVQTHVRRMIATNVVEVMRRNHNSTIIQTKWRSAVQHYWYKKTQALALWTQRMQRGRLGRRRYVKLNRVRKSIIIEKYWRRYTAMKIYKKERNAIWTIQCAVRCHFARQVLKKLQKEAKDLMAMAGEREVLKKENRALNDKLEIINLKLKAEAEKAAKAMAVAADAKAVENERDELKSHSEKLQTELEQIRSTLETESKRANDAELATKTKTDECEKLESEVSDCKQKMEQLEESSKAEKGKDEEEINSLKESVEQLNNTITELQTEKDSAAEEAKAKENSLLEEIEELKGDTEDLKVSLDEEKEAAVEKAVEDALEEARDLHEEEMQKLQEEMEQMRSELERANLTIKEHDEAPPPEPMVPLVEFEQSQKEVEDLKKELEELREQSVKDAEAAAEAAAKSARDEEANKISQEAAENAKGEFLQEKEALEETLSNLVKEKETVEATLEEVRKEKEDLEQVVENAQKEKEDNDESISLLRKEKEEVEKTRDELLKELENAEAAKKEAVQKAEEAATKAAEAAAAVAMAQPGLPPQAQSMQQQPGIPNAHNSQGLPTQQGMQTNLPQSAAYGAPNGQVPVQQNTPQSNQYGVPPNVPQNNQYGPTSQFSGQPNVQQNNPHAAQSNMPQNNQYGAPPTSHVTGQPQSNNQQYGSQPNTQQNNSYGVPASQNGAQPNMPQNNQYGSQPNTQQNNPYGVPAQNGAPPNMPQNNQQYGSQPNTQQNNSYGVPASQNGAQPNMPQNNQYGSQPTTQQNNPYGVPASQNGTPPNVPQSNQYGSQPNTQQNNPYGVPPSQTGAQPNMPQNNQYGSQPNTQQNNPYGVPPSQTGAQPNMSQNNQYNTPTPQSVAQSPTYGPPQTQESNPYGHHTLQAGSKPDLPQNNPYSGTPNAHPSDQSVGSQSLYSQYSAQPKGPQNNQYSAFNAHPSDQSVGSNSVPYSNANQQFGAQPSVPQSNPYSGQQGGNESTPSRSNTSQNNPYGPSSQSQFGVPNELQQQQNSTNSPYGAANVSQFGVPKEFQQPNTHNNSNNLMPQSSPRGMINITVEEVNRLRNEIRRLEGELAQAKDKAQAPMSPMDADFMRKQYEELKKYTDLMMEKDKEIMALKHEIMMLRERGGGTEIDSFDDSMSYYSSATKHRRRHISEQTSPMIVPESMPNEQDEALKGVNSMLREELNEANKEIERLKNELAEEKSKAQQDLEAFSAALKGVDELRSSAEIMGKELARMKQKRRREKARAAGTYNSYDDDDDDQTIVTVATATLDQASKVLGAHRRQQQTNPLWQRFKRGVNNARQYLPTLEEDE